MLWEGRCIPFAFRCPLFQTQQYLIFTTWCILFKSSNLVLDKVNAMEIFSFPFLFLFLFLSVNTFTGWVPKKSVFGRQLADV